RARDGSTRLADFFVAAPGLGLRHRRGGEMQLVDVGFGEATTTQPFRIGPASCAVPGAVAGLEAAHRIYGRLPWRELLAPALAPAREGGERPRSEAHTRGLPAPPPRAGDGARGIYSNATGPRLVAGETLRLTDLAGTLDAIARRGARVMYHGERA